MQDARTTFIVVEGDAGRQACGGTFCRRCWSMLDVSGVLGLLPDLLAVTQGRLAEARLTLGYNPQPLQGWCEGENDSGEGDSAGHDAMRRMQTCFLLIMALSHADNGIALRGRCM